RSPRHRDRRGMSVVQRRDATAEELPRPAPIRISAVVPADPNWWILTREDDPDGGDPWFKRERIVAWAVIPEVDFGELTGEANVEALVTDLERPGRLELAADSMENREAIYYSGDRMCSCARRDR